MMNALHRALFVAISLALAGVLLSCSESETTPSPAPAPPKAAPPENPQPSPPKTPSPKTVQESPDNTAALVARGRAVYTANCIACHNPEPSMPGAIGPEVAGSSFELLEARVMRNEYPVGYKPKRDTKAMIPLPYLENDLRALATFLNPAENP